MASTGRSTESIQALEALTDRLLSPDLTLAEAKDLRDRLLALAGGEAGAASLTMPCGCRANDPRSTGCRPYAA